MESDHRHQRGVFGVIFIPKKNKQKNKKRTRNVISDAVLPILPSFNVASTQPSHNNWQVQETICFVKFSLLNTSANHSNKSGSNYSGVTKPPKSPLCEVKSSDIIFHNQNNGQVYILLSKQRKPRELVLSLNDWGESVTLQCCSYSVHAVESVWIMNNYIQKNKRFLPQSRP